MLIVVFFYHFTEHLIREYQPMKGEAVATLQELAVRQPAEVQFSLFYEITTILKTNDTSAICH